MAKKILIINGPNINLLGTREPELYGSDTLADVVNSCVALAAEHGMTLDAMQSNHEGDIIDAIHKSREDVDAIIINAGAYTHTSIAIMDALNAFDGLVIEVHITQIHKRESFRHHSYISNRADGLIIGCGAQGYELAVLHVAKNLLS